MGRSATETVSEDLEKPKASEEKETKVLERFEPLAKTPTNIRNSQPQTPIQFNSLHLTPQVCTPAKLTRYVKGKSPKT